MAYEDNVPLDRLTHKHEYLSYDPTNTEAAQVEVVEHGGRTLEVIVPLFYDFLLCRFDRPFDDFWRTLGF